MAKKKISTQKKFLRTRLSARRKYLNTGAFALLTALVLGAAVGPWGNTLEAKKLRALFATAPSPPPVPPPSNPSKEYIYAGGRLIATEEPPSLAAPAVPVNLAATTISSFSSARIDVGWTASSGADHYEVERTQNIDGPYTMVSSGASTTFSDTSLNDAAYLYRVRAVGPFGAASPASNIDLATATSFADDPLPGGSTIKDLHVLQLREAIAKIRFAANLSSPIWTDSPIWGIPIKAVHIEELRTNLDEALVRLGLPKSPYTDSSLTGMPIKKVHIEELRQRIK